MYALCVLPVFVERVGSVCLGGVFVAGYGV